MLSIYISDTLVFHVFQGKCETCFLLCSTYEHDNHIIKLTSPTGPPIPIHCMMQHGLLALVCFGGEAVMNSAAVKQLLKSPIKSPANY